MLSDLLGMHIEGEGGFVGNYSPLHLFSCLERTEVEYIRRRAEMIALELVQLLRDGLKYWGRGSFDFLYNAADDKLKVVDPNARQSAPRYVIDLLNMLFGGDRPFFDMRSVSLPECVSVEDVHRLLSPDVLYKPGRSHGVVPFMWLPEYQVMYMAAFADDLGRLREAIPQVQSILDCA